MKANFIFANVYFSQKLTQQVTQPEVQQCRDCSHKVSKAVSNKKSLKTKHGVTLKQRGSAQRCLHRTASVNHVGNWHKIDETFYGQLEILRRDSEHLDTEQTKRLKDQNGDPGVSRRLYASTMIQLHEMIRRKRRASRSRDSNQQPLNTPTSNLLTSRTPTSKVLGNRVGVGSREGSPKTLLSPKKPNIRYK